MLATRSKSHLARPGNLSRTAAEPRGPMALLPRPPWARPRVRCPNCGLRFEREEGFFTGVYLVNYSFVAPSEAEMQSYFSVSPPSVHQMVLTLESNGFIERTPGKARSIRLLLAREDLPDLE